MQMQMEVQRRLSDQLEVQKSLKLKIEAQEKFLERIAEEFKTRPNITTPSKPFSPLSLPSLCDDSESNMKEFESDSEADKNEIRCEELRATKRLRVEENILQQRFKLASLNSGSYNPNLVLSKGGNYPYSAHEISFPWSVSACQSPQLPASYGSYN
ncbi:unnamed protein product [Ilex paraguariensis]